MTTYHIPDTIVRIILKNTEEEPKDFIIRAVTNEIEKKGWKQ